MTTDTISSDDQPTLASTEATAAALRSEKTGPDPGPDQRDKEYNGDEGNSGDKGYKGDKENTTDITSRP